MHLLAFPLIFKIFLNLQGKRHMQNLPYYAYSGCGVSHPFFCSSYLYHRSILLLLTCVLLQFATPGVVFADTTKASLLQGVSLFQGSYEGNLALFDLDNSTLSSEEGSEESAQATSVDNARYMVLRNKSSRSVSFNVRIDSVSDEGKKISRSFVIPVLSPGAKDTHALTAGELQGRFVIVPKYANEIPADNDVGLPLYEIQLKHISASGNISYFPVQAPVSKEGFGITVSEAEGRGSEVSFARRLSDSSSRVIEAVRSAGDSLLAFATERFFSGETTSGETVARSEVSPGISQSVSQGTAAGSTGYDNNDNNGATAEVSAGHASGEESRLARTATSPAGDGGVTSKAPKTPVSRVGHLKRPRSGGDPFVDLSSSFEVEFSGQKSSLDRPSRVLTSSANIRVKNISDEAVSLPLHLVVDTDPSSTQINLQGSLSAVGGHPYNTFYMVLGGAGGSLAPGATLDSSLVFSRPATVMFTYQVRVFGAGEPEVEKPVAHAGQGRSIVLYPGENSIPLLLDGSNSFNPGGGALEYHWSGVPGLEPKARPPVELSEGAHTFSLTVKNEDGVESDPSEVVINVTRLGEQQPPQISVDPKEYVITTEESVQFEVVASHPEAETVSLVAAPRIENVEFESTSGSSVTGNFSFSPEETQAGVYFFTFTAKTSYGLSATETVRVTVEKVNRAPVVSVAETFSVQEGQLLSIPVQASDPDGDIIGVSANNVPQNGVFIEGSRTLLFVPEYGQAGTYTVSFSASDGVLTSPPVQTQITVTEADSGGGTVTQLVLEVDPPESPNLQVASRITGRVNASASAPPVPKVVSALVQGLSPATLPQGGSGVIEITGQSAGSFPTGFISGVSRVSFGAGVEVTSVEVVTPSAIRAEVRVSPTAGIGPRSVVVQTDREVAVSIVAFNVTPGTTSVTGILKNPEGGAPLAGAIVSIKDTGIFAITAADGSFTLSGVPSGAQELIVNPPNSQILKIPIELAANQSLDLGELESESLVYDPSLPPSATVPSVLSRGLGDTSGRIKMEEAKQLIIDTFIALGGSEAGVLDEYGNQLNPKVEGEGLISLGPDHVEYHAENMARGETITLQEALYGISWTFPWSKGGPPTLLQFLKSVQTLVDEAWQDPRAKDSAMMIAIFNSGRGMRPEPPRISAETRLTSLQAQLLMGSFLGFVIQVRDANPDTFAFNVDSFRGGAFGGVHHDAGFLKQFSEFLIPSAHANDGSLVHMPPGGDIFTSFWVNLLGQWDNLPAGVFASGVGGAVSVALPTLIAGTMPSPSQSLLSSATGGLLFGIVRDLLSASMAQAIIETKRPQAPLPMSASQISVDSADGKTVDMVIVNFLPEPGDRILANPSGVKYAYRLWRWNSVGGELVLVNGGEPDYHGAAAGEQGNSGVLVRLAGQGGIGSTTLAIVDRNPKQGHNIYKIDVVRSIGDQDGSNGNNNQGQGIPWWTGFLPQPGFALNFAGGAAISFNPVGTLIAFLNPAVQIANGLKLMVSRMSDNIGAYVGPRAEWDQPDTMLIDEKIGIAYESVPSEDMIYAIDLDTFERMPVANGGFAAPYQSGLAIDPSGSLYSFNAAGADRFGGRIFKYNFRKTFNNRLVDFLGREHVGTVNYYSFMLQYANPTGLGGMCIFPDGELIVTDTVSRQIKKVPVNATYNVTARVGQVYVDASPQFQFMQGMDIACRSDGGLIFANQSNILEVDSNRSLRPMFAEDSGLFTQARSFDYDKKGTLYVADSGSGKILAIPAQFQNTSQTFTQCEKEELTILEGVQDLRFVRINPHQNNVFYHSQKQLKSVGLGVSGTVHDVNDQPVIGAEVLIRRLGAAPQKAARTNGCGVFHLLGLNTGGGSPIAEVVVSHPEMGSQQYLLSIDLSTHNFAPIVFNPPPIPEPEDDEPAIPEEEPSEQPQPITRQKEVTPGGQEVVDDVTIADKDPDKRSEEDEPPPPVKQKDNKPKVEIVTPVDGQEYDPEVLPLGEIEIYAKIKGMDDNIIARVSLNGTEFFSSAPGSQEFVSDAGLFKLKVKTSGLKDRLLASGGVGVLDVSIHRSADGFRVATSSVRISGKVSRVTIPETGVVETSFLQAETGALSGEILSETTGKPLAGVRVLIRKPEGDGFRVIAEAYTSMYGVYTFPRLPQGPLQLYIGNLPEGGE